MSTVTSKSLYSNLYEQRKMAVQIHQQHFIERCERVSYGQNKIDVIHFIQDKAAYIYIYIYIYIYMYIRIIQICSNNITTLWKGICCLIITWYVMEIQIEIFLSNVMSREKQFSTPNRVTSIIHSIKEG